LVLNFRFVEIVGSVVATEFVVEIVGSVVNGDTFFSIVDVEISPRCY
jgi:hypothetical protein